jgi:hypothetical protein
VNANIGVPRRKTQAKHHAARPSVYFNDFLLRQTDFLCDFSEIWAMFTAVANGDINLTLGGCRLNQILFQRVTHLRAERVKVCAANVYARGIKKRYGSVRGHNICDTLKLRPPERSGCR